ncbi:Unknown protein, partial [Striga hermonthica]
RGIPCRKGKSPFLESCMLKCFRTVSTYVDWDRHHFLFSRSQMTLILRTCPTSPKSFISNCLDNYTFTSDNIFTLFPMRRISSTYSTRNTTTFPSLFLEPDHPVLPQATVVAQFCDYHAEKFSGQGDPRIVDEWIQGLELIFEVMDCPDRYRVICAQLQLTGDAGLWWNAYWSMRPGEKEGCTWDRLKELIREKYYPTYYRAEIERQFVLLKQGTRSVDEYEREFTRIVAF